jgi:hypothetical protein
MNTLQDSASQQATSPNAHFEAKELRLMRQQNIVNEFFLRDSGCEMIESIHTLVEGYLFTENLAQVTPEMRLHIVNQLRVATLIAKLEANNSGLK